MSLRISYLLTNVPHLIVCPDGQLSRLPFEALPCGQNGNKFLVEEKTIRYVTSGREVVRIASLKSEAKSLKSPNRNSKSLVMGNPEFELDLGSARDRSAAVPSRSASDKTSATESSQRVSNLVAAAAEDSRAPLKSLSRSYRGLKFNPLPGSGIEATNVARLLGDGAVLRLGADAREAELKAVVSPRVLHLATPGFFLSDQEMNCEIRGIRESGFTLSGTSMGTIPFSRGSRDPRFQDWANPLVRQRTSAS